MKCAWCGIDVKNTPRTYIWADEKLKRVTIDRSIFKIPFCSIEHREKWLATDSKDVCFICWNPLKTDAPANQMIIKDGFEFYFCHEHRDHPEVEKIIDEALEELKVAS